ncbi:GNAT family N-acetyltransferase [Chenggangzhangella methanolivorans]|uniref:GNAT family N-acetyltransferase n=1 Tax=Chenggangzhangella methanolivorans TaxID=1437009 RepID=A0A9E6UMV6_9HYPH|nr:GNAT family N-acetyltransferase [Chenggangzhangella methanolivorans]QZN99553.1 GNAT family N-acetyltransferase [Chenggangzhangella methanolivorans]
MIVRPAALSDLGPAILMSRHFHKASGVEWRFETEKTRAFLRQFIASPDTLCLVVERDGVALGMFGASFNDHMFFTGKVAMVWGLWLEPEIRKTSAFREILRAFEAECGRRQVRMAVFAAQVKTPRIGRLFERLGFRPAETHYVRMFG